MAKNITVRVGDTLKNFQDINIARFNKVDGEQTDYIDADEMTTCKVFIFKYAENDAETDSANISTFISMRDAYYQEGSEVIAFIETENKWLLPASIRRLSQGSWTLAALNEFFDTSYEISLSASNISYNSTEAYNADAFDESSAIPATQESTAVWIKELINDQIVEGAW